ncbi:MAG: ABC transporter substrate-binding protein, partial [SAR324 cluster bacterium]|nr:ABC transporter substrate-binding protein [SAR324 cluster bacterium]
MSRPSGCSCQYYKRLLLFLLCFAGAGSLAAQSLLSQPQELEQGLRQLFPPISASASSVVTAQREQSSSGVVFPYRYRGNVPELDALLPADPELAAEELVRQQALLPEEEKEYYRLRIGAAQTDRSNVDSFAKAFLSHYPRSRYRDQVFLLWLEQSPVWTPTLEAAASVFVQDADSQQLRYYWSLRGRTAENQGNLTDALRYRLEEARLLDNEQQKEFNKTLESLFEKISNSRVLEQFSNEFADVPFIQQALPQLRLERLVKERNYAEGLLLCEQLLQEANLKGDRTEILRLENLQEFLRRRAQLKPHRVGVLLPLTTTIPTAARLTQQTIEGLRLALQEAPPLPKDTHTVGPLVDNFTKSTPADNTSVTTEAEMLAATSTDNITPVNDFADPVTFSRIDNQTAPQPDNQTEIIKAEPLQLPLPPRWEFVFRDTKLDPDTTRQGFRELVEDEHVMAVIGPLARRTSEAAAAEAETLKVPMISLSVTTSIADLGDYVFRNNISWEQEVEALLDYATEYLQARRFVVLYPDSREGREKLRVFWEQARAIGAQIQNIQRYENSQKSFVDEFESFTGIRRYRTDEEDALIEEQKDRGIPEQNFDAIFLIAGDQTQDLEIIFPYLEVYGLEDSLILGDSGWNNPLLLFAPKRETIRQAVFTDSFFPHSEAQEVQHFVAEH